MKSDHENPSDEADARRALGGLRGVYPILHGPLGALVLLTIVAGICADELGFAVTSEALDRLALAAIKKSGQSA